MSGPVTAGKALLIYAERNTLQKAVRMVVMVEEEVILFLFQIKIYGLYFILNFKNILKLKMGVTVENQEAQAQMVKIKLLEFQLVPL